MLLAYDGSGFRGFAAQTGVPTVAGALGEAIARAARLDEVPAIVCAGRTDAGVHAAGQVAHVDLPLGYDGDLARAVNRQTAPAVVVRSAEPVTDEFHARHSATSRHYRYLVWATPVPDPLLAALAWHVPDPLDLRAMAAASDPLIGEHDFRAFCRKVPGTSPDEPIVRRVSSARWTRVDWDRVSGPAEQTSAAQAPCGVLLRFDIHASSFCHQMVRSVVAALVDAGRGRATAASVMALLASGSRAGAPQPAPPHGLSLVGVTYRETAGPP